jgi:hypothetical protein
MNFETKKVNLVFQAEYTENTLDQTKKPPQNIILDSGALASVVR